MTEANQAHTKLDPEIAQEGKSMYRKGETRQANYNDFQRNEVNPNGDTAPVNNGKVENNVSFIRFCQIARSDPVSAESWVGTPISTSW